jgi:hypothetical protein
MTSAGAQRGFPVGVGAHLLSSRQLERPDEHRQPPEQRAL